MKPIRFATSPLLSERLPPWRQRLVLVVLLGAFALLIGRSLYLQGFNNEFLGDKGRARFERQIDISATRGRITDRHGDVLAVYNKQGGGGKELLLSRSTDGGRTWTMVAAAGLRAVRDVVTPVVAHWAATLRAGATSKARIGVRTKNTPGPPAWVASRS